MKKKKGKHARVIVTLARRHVVSVYPDIPRDGRITIVPKHYIPQEEVVVISGGDPTMDMEALAEYVDILVANGKTVAVRSDDSVANVSRAIARTGAFPHVYVSSIQDARRVLVTQERCMAKYALSTFFFFKGNLADIFGGVRKSSLCLRHGIKEHANIEWFEPGFNENLYMLEKIEDTLFSAETHENYDKVFDFTREDIVIPQPTANPYELMTAGVEAVARQMAGVHARMIGGLYDNA